MKRLLNRVRQNAARTATQAYRQAPLPAARLVLRIWIALPFFAEGSRDTEDGISRFDRLAVESAPQAALSLAEHLSKHPRRLVAIRRLADGLGTGGYPQAAVALMRAALDRHPSASEAYAGLGVALRRLGSRGHDDSRPSSSALAQRDELLLEAETHLHRATVLAPGTTRFRIELAELLFERGKTAEALALLCELHAQHRSAETAAALGRAQHRSEIANFDGAVEAYREALALNPQDRRTAARLNSVALRAGSWAGWEVLVARQEMRRRDPRRAVVLHDFEALFRGEQVLSTTPAETTARLHDLLQQGVPVEPGLLQAISARLQGLGEFRLGFEVRSALAEQVTRVPSNQLPRVASFQRWASAMVSLGRTAEVLERYGPYPWGSPSPESRRELDGLLADVHLSMGDTSSLVDVSRRTTQTAPSPGDERMAELLRGKRVAIVGPGLPSGSYGAEIDAFDIVIRTRFSPKFVQAHRDSSGARTDITYYSGTDIHALRAAAIPAAESGDIQLIVARPISYAALASVALDAPWLRFYRRDYSLIMNGGPLGITRIVHDTLQFEPSQLSLYNVDYYTGSETFARGYRTGSDTHASPGSIVMDLFRAHDLLADFVIHRNLFARGVLSGPPEVERIARLTPEEYTVALERAWRGRISPDGDGE